MKISQKYLELFLSELKSYRRLTVAEVNYYAQNPDVLIQELRDIRERVKQEKEEAQRKAEEERLAELARLEAKFDAVEREREEKARAEEAKKLLAEQDEILEEIAIEKEMQEAGLDHDAILKRRQEESYKIIQEFENWMNSVSGCFTPKSRMGKALVYTYTLLPRLSRYVLDGRYNIDNQLAEAILI